MKSRFKNLFTATLIVAVVALLGTGCEKEKNIGELPGCRDIVCKAGDNPTISFTAGGDWQLSSNQAWCQFITPAGNTQDMAGHAGTHTISLKITDEAIKNQPTFAEITMKMGGKKGIIAKIERGPNQLYMRLYDVTDTPLNPQQIKVGYVDYITLRIEANFRFAATNIPDWIELGIKEDGSADITPTESITGVPDEQTEVLLRIVPNGERERYAITAEDGHIITFTEANGEHTFDFPVVYDGMGTDELTFVGPTDQSYGWEVSLDGKDFQQKIVSDGTVRKYQNSLEFSIIAQNDNYHILRIEQEVDRGIPSYEIYEEGDNCWINFVRNPSDLSLITITIDPSDVTRYGLVMALPQGEWNKIRGSIDKYILEMDSSSGIDLPTIANEYQKYVIMEFTQHDIAEREEYDGMYIYHSITTLEIPAAEYNTNSVTDYYGVQEAYTCPFVNSIAEKKPGIIIDPRIEGWNIDNYENGIASADVWYKDEPLKMSENEFYIGENKDEILALHLWGREGDFTENVYVVFKVDGTPKKLLVVTPPVK